MGVIIWWLVTAALPVLTVVIPCFNAGALLEDQLAALARQQCRFAWEVLLADNGSTDDTRQRAAAWTTRLPLRVLDASAQRGQAYARNVGIAAARGECLAFCDSDDIVADGWATAMVDALREHPFVGCRLELEMLNTEADRAARGLQLDRGLEPTFEGCPPAAGACGLGVRRSLVERFGGFDARMVPWEDVEFCWRLQLSGIPLVFAPGAVVHYRMRRGVGALTRQAAAYGRAARLLIRWYGAYGLVDGSRSQRPPAAQLAHIARIAARLPRVVWRQDTRLPWAAHLAFQVGWYQGGSLAIPADAPRVA